MAEPLTYREVSERYKAIPRTQSLTDWASDMDKLMGSSVYSTAASDPYHIKKVSSTIDKLIEATGVPAVGKEFGGEFGATVGDRAAGERIGEKSGRMLLNFLPLLVPGAGWAATAARLGGTAALSGAEAYTETGSPTSGLIAGATAAALPKVADIAGQAALKRFGGKLVAGELLGPKGVSQVSRYFPETIGQKVAKNVAEQAAAAGAMEVGTKAQEVASGQPLSSPFSTETLLNLTLGQLPFAAIHAGGRALKLGKTEIQQQDILQKAIDVSEPVIGMRRAREEQSKRTDVEKIPEVKQPSEVSAAVAAETQSILARVRGEQLAVRKDPTLSDAERLVKTNELLQIERETLLRKQDMEPVPNSIFGNAIMPDAPRQEIVGTQLRTNKNGTWRAVFVHDDPFNPEELRGKVIGYSTRNEPNPVFGLQSVENQNVARWSLPEPQWRTTKTREEWDARYPKKEPKPPVEPGVVTPELPVREEPLSPDELDNHLHELEKVALAAKAAETPADAQEAVVALNEVQNANDIPATDDTTLKLTADKIAATGLVSPENVSKIAVIVESKRTAKRLTAKQKAMLKEIELEQEDRDREARGLPPRERTERELERAALEPTGEERSELEERYGGEGGFSVQTLDRLSHANDDVVNDMVSDLTSEAVASLPEAKKAFDKWNKANDEPSTFEKDAADFFDIVENFGATKLPTEEVAKFLNDRMGTTTWDDYEVSSFMIRPHVSLWLKNLDTIMAARAAQNATKFATAQKIPNFGSPWTDQELQAVKGEPNYIPTVDLISWAKTQPEFAEQVARYKTTSATGGEPDAVAMEEIAHRMAYESNARTGERTRAQGIPAGGGFIFGIKPLEQIQGMPKTGIMPETKFTNVGSIAGAFSKAEMGLMKELVPEAFDKGQVDVNKLQAGLQERGPVIEIKTRGGKPTTLDEQYDQAETEYTVRETATQLQHELETRGFRPDIHFDEAIMTRTSDGKEVVGDWISPADFDPERQVRLEDLHVTDRSLINQWFESANSIIGEEWVTTGRQTDRPQYAFIAPKSPDRLPGYVEGLVRLPLQPATLEEMPPERRKVLEMQLERGIISKDDLKRQLKTGFLYSGPHFGAEDINVLSFFRGYEETLPDGTKAFHVIEVQSDWGQTVRESQEKRKIHLAEVKKYQEDFFDKVDKFRVAKTYDGSIVTVLWYNKNNENITGVPSHLRDIAIRLGEEFGEGTRTVEAGGFHELTPELKARLEKEGMDEAVRQRGVLEEKHTQGTKEHPLLEAYNGLALKAAIQHAKSVGATKLIISDANTAMMTEGHDRYVEGGEVFRNAVIPANRQDLVQKAEDTGLMVTQPLADGTRQVYEENRGVSDRVQTFAMDHNLDIRATTSMGQDLPREPAQAKGMRLHYDNILPSAAEKLTKSKPEMVDLGTHKATIDRGGIDNFAPIESTTDNEFGLRDLRTGEIRTFPTFEERDAFMYSQREQPVGSPILKDAQGKPKTNITGRMYDLGQTPEEFTLMGRARAQKMDFNQAVTELGLRGFAVKKSAATGEYYAVGKRGQAFSWKAGSPEETLMQAIKQGPPPPARYVREPIYIPKTPGEAHAATQLGIDMTGTGNGIGLVEFLRTHENPFYAALGADLVKIAPDTLQRIAVTMRQSNGSYAWNPGGNKMEVALESGLLNTSRDGQAFAVAHELLHGLTTAELDNPLKRPIVDQLDGLRQRLIDNLPSRLKKSHNDLMDMDWYRRYSLNEISADMNDALPGRKLSISDQEILYGLMTTKELVAQGFSMKSFRDYMGSVRAEQKTTGFQKFVNLVKQMVGIGEKVSDTALGEFLSHSHQLLQQGDYVSSFHNFANGYFERLGQPDSLVNLNTKRALGLVNDAIFGTSPSALLTQIRISGLGRSPEITRATRDMQRMFAARGDDFATTVGIMDEHNYPAQASGIDVLAEHMMLGEIANYGDILNTLPPDVTAYMFAIARDTRQILGVLQAATRDANKGILNIADPKLISGPVAEALRGIDGVLKYEAEHQKAKAMVDAWEGVPPSGHLDKIISDPSKLPAWQIGADKTKSKDSFVHWFLEPIGQWARRVPEVAEAVAKGWQLDANSRKMAGEALKAFGTDLTTMNLSEASVKLVDNILKVPKLTKAVDQWLWTNQRLGKEANAVNMLDSDHPEIVKILEPLSTREREQVEDLVQKHQISQQQMQAQILEKMLQIASTRGGVMTGLPIKDGTKAATILIDALRVDRNDPNAARVADAQIDMVQKGMQPEQFLNLLKYSETVVGEWKTMQQFYQENPAWSSGQRYGKYLVTYKRGKKVYLAGVDSKKEADVLAEGATIVKFEPNQKGQDDMAPALGPSRVETVTKLREYQERQHDMLLNSGRFTQEDVANIKKWSPVEAFVSEEAYKGGVPGLTPQPRGLTKGAEELPWLRNHFSWVKKTSTYWSRQLFRAQAHAQLLDPAIAQNAELQKRLRTHYENMLTPDTPVGHFFQRAAMNWFMGFNPASALVNATQPFLTHTAEFTSMTGKPVDSYRRTIGALNEIRKYYQSGKKSWGDADVDWAMHKAAQDGERDLAMFDDDAATQESIHTNYKRIMDGQRTQTLGQRLNTMAGSWSTAAMWMFRGVERMNNDAALLSSFKYYKEQGLNNEAALDEAYKFNHAVNYGGGVAARPTGIFSGRGVVPRTAAMLSTSMQSYVLGSTFQIARYIQKGYFRPEGLKPAEVYAARKAAVQMLSVQLASAGVLGMPFVSGAIALLDKVFPDLEINRHLREWVSEILGGDKENGSILSDAALMGVPSMFGWDLQSRLSMGNTVPGVSEINGFDPELLLGAPVNMVSNFVKGGQRLTQGDISAVDKFVPPALKKITQWGIHHGETVDYRNRPLFTPNAGEVMGMAVGFQPTRLTKLNAAARLADAAQENITRRKGEFHQQMASQVLKGNFGSVRAELRSRMQDDRNFDPQESVRAIARAAEEMTFQRDLRREGTAASGDVRSKLLSSFNLAPSQADETSRLLFRQNVAQRLGLPVSSESDLRLAATMDQLRRQNPEASRSEIRRQAERLLRGPRLQTLASP